MMRNPLHRAYFEDLGWHLPGAITYQFNSHGFRCDEFAGGPYLLTLGCSYTMGIGLPLEMTWPSLLANRLGLKVANLAWPGYSADSCFRLARYWVPILKPQLVVMMTPSPSRFELLLDTQGTNLPGLLLFMPNCKNFLVESNDQFIQHWYTNEDNGKLNNERNRLAVKQICAEHHAPCIVDTIERFMWWSREKIGYARDYMHGGPKAHTNIVDSIMEQYEIL